MSTFTSPDFLLQKTTWLLSIIAFILVNTNSIRFFIVSTKVPDIETRLSNSFQFPKHSVSPSLKAWHVYCFSFFPSKANLNNDYTQPCVTQQLHRRVLHKVRTFPSNSLCCFAPKCHPPDSFPQLAPHKGGLHMGTTLQWIAMQITSLLWLYLTLAHM